MIPTAAQGNPVRFDDGSPALRPNEISSGGVVVRPAAHGPEICLVSDGKHWGFPKGLVEPGESPEERRAARDRRGDRHPAIVAQVIAAPLPSAEYVFRRPNRGALVFKRVHHFLVGAPENAALHPDPAEIAEAAWLGFDDARGRLTFQNSIEVLDAARALLAAGGIDGAHRRIGQACNSSTPPARRWCPSSRSTGGSGSTSAASRRTTRRTSVTPSSITCSTSSAAASATRASRCAACATSPMLTTTSSVSRACASVDFRELAEEQVALFDAEMAAIGLRPVDVEPRATEHVAEMADWVAAPRRSAATHTRWTAGCSSTPTSIPDYGRLSRLDHDTMIRLSRERGADPDDPRKRHPLDFVLWQASAPESRAGRAPGAPGGPAGTSSAR